METLSIILLACEASAGVGDGDGASHTPAPPARGRVASRAGAPGPAPSAQPGAGATCPRTVTWARPPARSAAFRGTAGPKRTAERQPVKPRAPARSVSGSAPRGSAGREADTPLGLMGIWRGRGTSLPLRSREEPRPLQAPPPSSLGKGPRPYQRGLGCCPALVDTPRGEN